MEPFKCSFIGIKQKMNRFFKNGFHLRLIFFNQCQVLFEVQYYSCVRDTLACFQTAVQVISKITIQSNAESSFRLYMNHGSSHTKQRFNLNKFNDSTFYRIMVQPHTELHFSLILDYGATSYQLMVQHHTEVWFNFLPNHVLTYLLDH